MTTEEIQPEPEDPERWPIPAEDPEEEPVHEGAEGEPPKEEDGTISEEPEANG